ncbi:hypothetical protein ACFX1X_014070 [Malus domestica]
MWGVLPESELTRPNPSPRPPDRHPMQTTEREPTEREPPSSLSLSLAEDMNDSVAGREVPRGRPPGKPSWLRLWPSGKAS